MSPVVIDKVSFPDLPHGSFVLSYSWKYLIDKSIALAIVRILKIICMGRSYLFIPAWQLSWTGTRTVHYYFPKYSPAHIKKKKKNEENRNFRFLSKE